MIWFCCETNFVNMSPQNEFYVPQVNTVDSEIDYRSDFSKLLENYRSLQRENQQLKSEIQFLKTRGTSAKVRKFKRRTENELIKNFKCIFQGCKKQYASQLALNLHLKTKHAAGSKRDRLLFATEMMRAQAEGREITGALLNLPPAYLQTLKSQRLISNRRRQQDKQKKSPQNQDCQ